MSVVNSVRFDELKRSDRLPSPAGVGMRILRVTRSDRATAEQIATIVQTDPALAGRVLCMANSSQYGASRTVASLQDAVVRLGFSSVRNVALGFSLLSSYRSGACAGFNYEAYWALSLATAIASQELSPHVDILAGVDGYTCGLLCQIGRLALATVYPNEYAPILEQCKGGSADMLVRTEREKFATDHNELGAAMLADWGLPDVCAYAVLVQRPIPGEAQPGGEPAARLAEQLRLARLIARICVSSEQQQAVLLPELYERGKVYGLSCDQLVELCVRVSNHWTDLGEALGISLKSAQSEAEQLIDSSVESQPEAESPAADVPVSAEQPTSQTAEDATTQSGTTPKTDEPENQPLRILVVEDEPVTLSRLSALLRKAGHEVMTASNGREALETALKNVPQLIIADWLMPEMSGLELCQALRQSRVGRQMYITILTSQHEEAHLVEAFEAGADDYITKPLRAKVLLARLCASRRVIELQDEIARDKEEIDRYTAELAVANRMLQKAALTDELTGLPNRRHLLERIDQQWAEADRHDREFSCLTLDIDHFKRVNDTYGHDIGDEVLRVTAEVIRESIRGYDIACRLGGEEFVVICPDADSEAVQVVAERIRAAVEAKIATTVDDEDVRVTISIGVASKTDDILDPDSLLKLADDALYAAKNSGRNRVHVAGKVQPRVLAGQSAR